MVAIRLIAPALAAAALLASCSQEGAYGIDTLPEGLYASFNLERQGRTLGELTFRLDYPKEPLLAANFAGLASGRLALGEGDRPFYEGKAFYRVDPGLAAFAGAAEPDGSGGVDWRLPDGGSAALKAPGLLAMAMAGPDSASSAFLVTLSPSGASYPDGFGEGLRPFGRLVAGMELLARIAQGDRIAAPRVIAKGALAREFLDGLSGFHTMLDEAWKTRKDLAFDAQARALESIYEARPMLKRSPRGLLYEVLVEGSTVLAAPGQTVALHFTLKRLDGRVLFDSRSRASPVSFVLGEGKALPALEEAAALMAPGERRYALAPPELCYGGEGLRDDWGYEIEPWAWLVFEDLERVQ